MTASGSTRRRYAMAASALLCVLALPPIRHALESGMTTHMLIQFPMLALCGAMLAHALPERWRAACDRWNMYGVSGLLAAAMIQAVLMIPRVLDMALVDARIEAAKWLALLVCGAALRLSWRPAGLLVQGFFLGNVLPMMVVAGHLFQDTPVRLCNAYLLDDQVRLGRGLVWIAATVAAVWLALVIRAMMRRESQACDALPAP